MRHRIGPLLLTVFLVVPNCKAESNPVIRKRVSEVRLTLVATDRNDRPLINLSPADIVVLEDGQPIPHFELRPAANLPLRIGIVLDLSDSTQKSWGTVRNTLLQSLQRSMRADDELLVSAFNTGIELERTVADPGQLQAALAHPKTGGLTALFDTLYHVCDQAIFTSDQGPHRSALILFSDGEDDLSLHDLSDAIAKAEVNGVAIYTVSAHNPKTPAPGDVVLHDLAVNTGGRDFVAKDANQLQEALAAIDGELRTSYLLYYRPPEDSGKHGFRRVYVLPTRGDGAQVRSRAGYFTAP